MENVFSSYLLKIRALNHFSCIPDGLDLLLLDEAGLDDEDLLLLYPLFDADAKEILHAPFDLESLTEEDCLSNFRFSKEDLLRLKTALRMPQYFVMHNRAKASGLEALCILLRRLAYPNRLTDLTPLFGRSKFDLSRLFNMALDHVYDTFAHLLSDFNQPWFAENLDIFARSINEKGAPLINCVGFIDGTVRPICRPSQNQQVMFNGHKRTHAVKFQSIVTPNGLIANLAGPFEGKRHDSYLLDESGVLPQIAQLRAQNGEPYCIYGDPAYALQPAVMVPFRGLALTAEEEGFNRRMSAVRQCVEWGFNKVVMYFAFLDFKKNLKLLLQPIGKYYMVGCILANCHTCLYGSQTGTYFGVEAPQLEAYLQ